MTRLKYRGLLVLALCVTASGCGTEFPATPTTPTPITLTEEFTGTLSKNGSLTYPFAATTSGAVNLTVVSLTDSNGPAVIGVDGTIRIGLELGTWNGTVCAVTTPTLSNDDAFVATVITGAVTGAGALCARVHDATNPSTGTGKLTEAVAFDIRIEHP